MTDKQYIFVSKLNLLFTKYCLLLNELTVLVNKQSLVFNQFLPLFSGHQAVFIKLFIIFNKQTPLRSKQLAFHFRLSSLCFNSIPLIGILWALIDVLRYSYIRLPVRV